MKFREAINQCHVRSAIYRPNGYHANIPDDFKFWKNHNAPLECRVAWQDQIEDDWREYDPHEEN
jgi:hypothetical protein